jgi:hypothetical protein
MYVYLYKFSRSKAKFIVNQEQNIYVCIYAQAISKAWCDTHCNQATTYITHTHTHTNEARLKLEHHIYLYK